MRSAPRPRLLHIVRLRLWRKLIHYAPRPLPKKACLFGDPIKCDNVSDRGVTGSQIKTEYALIAQSVEHAAVNRGVTGSSPVWGAKGKHSLLRVLFFCFSIALQLVSLCFGRGVAAVNWLTDLRSRCEMKQVR